MLLYMSGAKNVFCNSVKCERCTAQQQKHARRDWGMPPLENFEEVLQFWKIESIY